MSRLEIIIIIVLVVSLAVLSLAASFAGKDYHFENVWLGNKNTGCNVYVRIDQQSDDVWLLTSRGWYKLGSKLRWADCKEWKVGPFSRVAGEIERTGR